MAGTVALPADVWQAHLWATHNSVLNKKDPDKLDRSDMPFHNFLMSKKREYVFLQGQLVQKLKRAGGRSMQYPGRLEARTFSEVFTDSEMVWEPQECHMGGRITHKDLMERGYKIIPNQSRGRDFAKKIPKAASDQLVEYAEEMLETLMDDYDVALDRDYHLDGTQATNAPAGLDALLPLDNTTGTIGGQDRSDPLFRHHVITGSTVTSGGTLEKDIRAGIRAAQNRNRGMAGKIDLGFVGGDYLDGYIQYAKNNGMTVNTDAETPTSVDIAFTDNVSYNRIRLVRDPTFEALDAAGLYTGTPWEKRAYFLSSKSWAFAFQSLDKELTFPNDPADLRISQFSLDGYYSLICRAPNQQFVNTIA